ncbi:MAG: toxin-antitoxin system HicB family antitoxin [Candidatus Adiutrix sp.]|jgi:predicted HicB family RNase H-like nuclease|nr:toxin-antitoxin system HicB family antitoxin [Candidatus Adiutrix sp.]
MKKKNAALPPLAQQYAYRVVWSDEDREFVGLCAEFPSLSWLAEDQGKALKGIVSLVMETVDDMRNDNEALPEPLSLRKYSGKFVVRTTPELHKHLIIKSAEAGVSLNRLVNAMLGESGNLL